MPIFQTASDTRAVTHPELSQEQVQPLEHTTLASTRQELTSWPRMCDVTQTHPINTDVTNSIWISLNLTITRQWSDCMGGNTETSWSLAVAIHALAAGPSTRCRVADSDRWQQHLLEYLVGFLNLHINFKFKLTWSGPFEIKICQVSRNEGFRCEED